MKEVSETQFIEALATLMRQRGISFDTISGGSRAPKGTWIAVGELTGQSKAAATIYRTACWQFESMNTPRLESSLARRHLLKPNAALCPW